MKISQIKQMGFFAQMVAVVFMSLAFVACDVAGELLDITLGIMIPVTGITGVPTEATAGESLTLNGTVTPAGATYKTITWSVTSGSATLSGNGGNILTPSVANSTITVTATIAKGLSSSPVQDFTKDFVINVKAAEAPFVPVTNITNVPGAVTAGSSITLGGTVEPWNATNKNIEWIWKSGPASISGNTLYATGTGAASIVVIASITNGASPGNHYTKEFTITVNAAGTDFVPVTDISVVPTTATTNVPVALSYTVTPSNATNQAVTWSVSGPATINGNTLTATAAGTVTVTATIINGLSAGNFSRNFTITVTDAFVPVTGISNVPGAATAGEPLALSGTVTPSDATNKTITWEVKSSGTTAAGASISGNTLHTTGAGTVVVIATVANGRTNGTNYTQEFTITVNSGFVPVTDISVASATATAKVPFTLTRTVTPPNATNQTTTWTVKSGTEGTTGASISGDTLHTTGAGTVVVIATIANGEGPGTNFTREFTITVNMVPVTDIGNVPTLATLNEPLALSGTVTPSNATNQTITWNVKSGSATISGNSLTATAAGDVVVTARIANGSTTGDYTKDFTISVFVPVTNISNVPTEATLGVPLTLSGTVMPSNATNQTITWSVTSGSANITGGNTLTVTGAGTVEVTARIASGAGPTSNFSKVFMINVFVPVTGITGVPGGATVNVPLALSGTVAPSNATNKTITWNVKSGSANISNGNLTATAAGTVTVTATVVNGKTAATNYTQDFNITVNNAFVPVTDITNVPATAIIGTPLTLTGTVAPSNATNQTITWARKSGVLATVTSSGSFTPNTVGDIVVTATIANGLAAGSSYTKDFTITVQPVAVTDITGVPTTATVGTNLNLNTGTAVVPSTATNKTIAWSVASTGTTGATISGSTLSTTGTGTVIITATITNGLASGTNYTQNFTITVQPIAAAFNNLTANGSSGGTSIATTTQLTLTFDRNITDLAADDITLSPGTTGAVKGALTKATGTGVYNLAVSGITSGGDVTVTVTKPNYAFSPASKEVTVHARGTLTPLTITFNQIADEAPSITGPTIYRVSGPTSATITVDNPTQYDSISWRVQNTTVTGTGSSFTLSAANSAYNLIGDHFVTVMVMKGGVPYNKTVSFKVEY